MAAKNKKPAEKKDNAEKNDIDLKNQLARALADYDNLRKRVETEKAGWFRFASAKNIERFLPVLDMLIDAQKHINDQGLAIVIGEFQKTIYEEGFKEVPIETGISDFDSLKMEAVETVENGEEDKKGKVAEVVLSGWQSVNENDDRAVIRPAKVKVYK